MITTDGIVFGDRNFIRDYRLNGAEGYTTVLTTIDKIAFSKKEISPDTETGERRFLTFHNYHVRYGDWKDIIPVAHPLEDEVRKVLDVPNPADPIDGNSIIAFYQKGELKGFTGLNN